MPNETAQQEWKRKTLGYVKAINDYVERGYSEGWDKAGKQPEDPDLKHLVKDALAALRRANADGYSLDFRNFWPPLHEALIPILEKNGQSIPVVCLLDDGSIVARIGTNYQPGRTIRIRGDKVEDVPEVGYFGRSPNRRFFGVAQENGIAILDGWQGPQVALCLWPTGNEDLPDGVEVEPWEGLPKPSYIVPFPDGRRVLIASEYGIFVLTETSAHRLIPTLEQMRDHPDWSLSMEHGAVSQDGKFIAVGCQDSSHLVFDDRLNLIGEIGHQSEYPHFAVFSADQSMIAFNSCHFYSGATIGVPTRLLPGLKTESYKEDTRTPILQDGARVYAAVGRADEFIIGDASGYVRAFDLKGNHRWQLFIGSSVGDIDVSPDGKTLLVSTCAGFLSIFRLDTGEAAPHQIGTGKHFEERRWIFWKSEPKPLIW